MNREELLVFLAAEIVKCKYPERPLKVAIDGRCASGKTVLANELALALAPTGWNVLRSSVDGFHHPRERRYKKGEYSAAGYYQDAYDFQAVIDFLLAPLSGDSFPVWCRKVAHDVRTDMPVAAPPVSVGADSVLLFEGLFLFRIQTSFRGMGRPFLRRYTSTSAYCRAVSDVRSRTRTDGRIRKLTNSASSSAARFPCRKSLRSSPKTTAGMPTSDD
jgi:uridine kinase